MDFIKNFKFIYQNDDYSCGRCCVYMIAELFGIDKSHRPVMSELLNTDRNSGTYQKDIVATLNVYGLTTKVFSETFCTLRAMKSQSKKNRILICYVDSDHWIVVRGFSGSRVYIADPALQKPYISLNTFAKRIVGGSFISIWTK